VSAYQRREYQVRTIGKVLEAEKRGSPSVCIVAPPGSGKTYMMVYPALAIAARRGQNNRAGAVVAVAHRIELVTQLADAIRECGVDCGIIAQGYPRTNHIVQVCSIQSLISQGALPPATVCVFDECHHAVAPSYNEIYRAYTRMGAFQIGGTASPERSDGVGLYPTYRKIIVAGQRQKLIKQGYLVPTTVMSPRRILRRGVADIPVRLWERHARGTRTIVFAADTAHGREMTAEFQQRGWPTGYVDGDLHPKVREEVIQRFVDGRTMVLVNIRILTEGFNLPAIQTVVLACPVGHAGLYLQMVGRAGRPDKGKKEGLCLDLCGNWHVHGLPDDSRKFQLRGRPVQLEKTSYNPRKCPRCDKVWRSACSTCPHCGIAKPRTRRALKKMSESLIKANPRKAARTRQNRYNELWDMATVRGMKGKQRLDWIEKKFRARFGMTCAHMKPTHKKAR
jgi:superfamily II DNA or RNA helicase